MIPTPLQKTNLDRIVRTQELMSSNPSESSYHAPYDHCTAEWLEQAGVKNSFIRLTDLGIHGNGHMMMLEKNNLEISALLRRWEQDNIR
jgi:hypothetical protein